MFPRPFGRGTIEARSRPATIDPDTHGFPGRLIGAPLKRPHDGLGDLRADGVSPTVWSGHH